MFMQHEAVARWMVHTLDYGVLSTISSSPSSPGSPFGNPQSFIDGGCKNSTGVIYMFVSGMDQSIKDTESDPRVSFTLSEAYLNGGDRESKSCSVMKGGDPENPPCARAVFNGRFVKVEEGGERDMALQGFYERHPTMKDWPVDHGFFVGKVEIEWIWLIDMYGGAKNLDVDKYFGIDM